MRKYTDINLTGIKAQHQRIELFKHIWEFSGRRNKSKLFFFKKKLKKRFLCVWKVRLLRKHTHTQSYHSPGVMQRIIAHELHVNCSFPCLMHMDAYCKMERNRKLASVARHTCKPNEKKGHFPPSEHVVFFWAQMSAENCTIWSADHEKLSPLCFN